MRKTKFLILALVCAVLLAGCGDMKQHVFRAEVTEVGENYMLVREIGGSDFDLYSLGLSDISDGSAPLVGDTYEIKYRGGIIESFPAQFQKLIRVTRVEKT
jgi:hypothetical protein